MSPWNERDGSRLSGRERSLARRFASAIGKLLIFKHGNGLRPYRRVKRGSRRPQFTGFLTHSYYPCDNEKNTLGFPRWRRQVRISTLWSGFFGAVFRRH